MTPQCAACGARTNTLKRHKPIRRLHTQIVAEDVWLCFKAGACFASGRRARILRDL